MSFRNCLTGSRLQGRDDGARKPNILPINFSALEFGQCEQALKIAGGFEDFSGFAKSISKVVVEPS